MIKDNKVSSFNSKNKGKYRKKKSYFRYKFCYLTKNRIQYIDYKDTELLKRFISKSGKIIPRYISGTKCKFQKHIALAIKRARFMGLLSYNNIQEQERNS